MSAIGQKSFHFALFPVEHLSDLFCINWFQFLIRHTGVHAARYPFRYQALAPLAKLYSLPMRKR
jgi:archaellum component FlaD/FlaE